MTLSLLQNVPVFALKKSQKSRFDPSTIVSVAAKYAVADSAFL